MREIKFRAWDGKKYISHDSLCCPSFSLSEILYGSGFTVEQFTGLRDKNGKEIYENDICKIRFDIDKVEDYIYASLTEKEIRTCERIFVVESPLFNNQPELNADIIEIIGNIHENPEILND